VGSLWSDPSPARQMWPPSLVETQLREVQTCAVKKVKALHSDNGRKLMDTL